MLLWVVSRVESRGQFSVEFEEGSEATLVFVRTRDRETFLRVCVAVLRKNSGEASCDTVVLGQLLIVVGPSMSLVALVGGLTCSSRHIRCYCWECVPR